jgi:hypothetical protein
MCILERENIYDQYAQGSLAMLSCSLLIVLNVELLKILEAFGAYQ